MYTHEFQVFNGLGLDYHVRFVRRFLSYTIETVAIRHVRGLEVVEDRRKCRSGIRMTDF